MDQHKHFTVAAKLDDETGRWETVRLEHNEPERIRAYLRALAPGTWQSDERRKERPVGRHGNLYLKAAFTEAAQTAVRYDAGLGAFYQRLRRRKGTGKAMVAAARKLAVAVYHMLKERRPYRAARNVLEGSGKPVLRPGRT
jgi:hypothetical protein